MFLGEGIVCRPIEEGDLEKVRILRNDPSTWMQLTNIGHISSEDQRTWFVGLKGDPTRQYFVVFQEKADEHYPVHVEGEFVGIIRMDEIDRINRSARVGADVVPAMRGQGYGTRIYQALLRYCFDLLGLHRVWLLVLDSNDVGLKLYFHSGFILEGKHRDAIFRNGKFHDYLLMSILEKEYRERNDS
jgi:diamine N-acetyltransferase